MNGIGMIESIAYGIATGYILGLVLIWARERMPHSWEHALRLNRSRCERLTLPNGCSYVCAVCSTCSKVRPVAHSAYCDGCGREPR